MKNTKDLSLEELENLLAEKKKEEAAKEKAEKLKYIKERDRMIINLCLEATKISEVIERFNANAHEAMRQQKIKLDEYGKIRKNSKGGFQLITEDGEYKIQYAYNGISDYDERANKAEELLKDFLQDKIQKKDKVLYGMIVSLLERNKAGRLEFSRIQSIYKYETEFDDPRWKEALKLFKESFVLKDSKMQPLFYKKNDKGTYDLIKLNFSSI